MKSGIELLLNSFDVSKEEEMKRRNSYEDMFPFRGVRRRTKLPHHSSFR